MEMGKGAEEMGRRGTENGKGCRNILPKQHPLFFLIAFHGSISDSLLLLEVVQTNITRHEEEMAQMETQIDSDHASELLKLQELLREESKQDLLRSKDNLIKDLHEIGQWLVYDIQIFNFKFFIMTEMVYLGLS